MNSRKNIYPCCYLEKPGHNIGQVLADALRVLLLHQLRQHLDRSLNTIIVLTLILKCAGYRFAASPKYWISIVVNLITLRLHYFTFSLRKIFFLTLLHIWYCYTESNHKKDKKKHPFFAAFNYGIERAYIKLAGIWPDIWRYIGHPAEFSVFKLASRADIRLFLSFLQSKRFATWLTGKSPVLMMGLRTRTTMLTDILPDIERYIGHPAKFRYSN